MTAKILGSDPTRPPPNHTTTVVYLLYLTLSRVDTNKGLNPDAYKWRLEYTLLTTWSNIPVLHYDFRCIAISCKKKFS